MVIITKQTCPIKTFSKLSEWLELLSKMLKGFIEKNYRPPNPPKIRGGGVNCPNPTPSLGPWIVFPMLNTIQCLTDCIKVYLSFLNSNSYYMDFVFSPIFYWPKGISQIAHRCDKFISIIELHVFDLMSTQVFIIQNENKLLNISHNFEMLSSRYFHIIYSAKPL